jgi:hypothetical protein
LTFTGGYRHFFGAGAATGLDFKETTREIRFKRFALTIFNPMEEVETLFRSEFHRFDIFRKLNASSIIFILGCSQSRIKIMRFSRTG